MIRLLNSRKAILLLTPIFVLSSCTTSAEGDAKVTKIEATTERVEFHTNDIIDMKDYFVVSPNNATNKEFVLSCSDDDLLINGYKITSSVAKEYEVTATTLNNLLTASIKVNFVGDVDPEPEGYSKVTTKIDYRSFMEKRRMYSTPSTGSPNIIVVPVAFSDTKTSSPWNSTRINALNVAVNGSKEDGSNAYWESLTSFYKKSSYGTFTPNFIISDVFNTNYTSSKFKEDEQDYIGANKLLEEIYDGLKINNSPVNFEDSMWDQDNNGIVDGIWMIYNVFGTSSSALNKYWAYTSWYSPQNDTPKNFGCFANMAGGFTYSGNNQGYDAHTLIHETGHMLGLDDYYDYSKKVAYTADGSIDMMNLNIGDHNAYSKFALNWINPYLANKSGKITLKPFESTGDALIIPSNYWNDSAFSEYLIIEYYTPTGVNEKDATELLPTRIYNFQDSGLKVWHVDSRIYTAEYRYSYTSGSTSIITEPEVIPATYGYNDIPDYYEFSEDSSSYQHYSEPNVASNARVYSYNTGKDLIALCDAKNRTIYNKRYADDDSLWKTKNQVINSSNISVNLQNGKWYSGEKFNYEIKIESINEEGITLDITLNN